jgi:GNAT superfamily N-acetyltransferase
MSRIAWVEEPVSRLFDRDRFDCGEPALNEYLRKHARQNHELGAAKTFLAIDAGDRRSILGYYSLSPGSILYSRTPAIVRKGLARHDVPVFRLARLAVDRKMQGRGLGADLLLAAGKRCLLASAEIGGVAMLIDAKNERAAAWYKSFGAVPILDAPQSLLLTLASLNAVLGVNRSSGNQ